MINLVNNISNAFVSLHDLTPPKLTHSRTAFPNSQSAMIALNSPINSNQGALDCAVKPYANLEAPTLLVSLEVSKISSILSPRLSTSTTETTLSLDSLIDLPTRPATCYYKKIEFRSGTYYGNWIDSYGPHGSGYYVSSYCYTYEGAWAQGKKQGYGELIYADGDKKNNKTYKGTWKNDLFDGIGTLSDKNGLYIGSWKEGFRHGQGEQTSLKGKFVGQWDTGVKNGKGIYYYANEEKFEGEWVNGLRDGEGKFTYPNGSALVGTWVNDDFVNGELVRPSKIEENTIEERRSDANK